MWYLCFVGFSSTLFEQLKKSCGSLRSFSISHDQFMDCNERELYESLPKTLAHFGLPHCNIDLEKFKTIISPGTVYCVFLLYQYVSFPLQQDSFFAWAGCSCWGGAKYQISFADWWSTNKKIEKQNIKTASIWPSLIPLLFAGFPFTCLTSLDLSGAYVSLFYLSEKDSYALPKSLTTLILRDTMISLHMCNKRIVRLIAAQTPLKQLDISLTNISIGSLELLASSLENLQVLNMAGATTGIVSH